MHGIAVRDASWHSRGFQDGFDLDDSSAGSPSDAAVVVAGAKSVSIENCSFVGVGGGGVLLTEGASGVSVVGSLFSRIGQSGVMGIGNGTTQPSNVQIESNTMDRIGETLNSAGGVFLTTARDVLVSGNKISNTSRWGVAMRSNGNEALSRNVVISGNTIIRTGLHTRDFGGISTIDSSEGSNTGVVIEGNCVRDVIGADTDQTGQLQRPFFSWALYLDNFSSNTVVRKNVVVNSSYAGLFYHEGRNNSATNNVLAHSNTGKQSYQGAMYVLPSKTWPVNDSMHNGFSGNIVYSPGSGNAKAFPPAYLWITDGRKGDTTYLTPGLVSRNVYFDPAGNASASLQAFDGYSFPEWRAKGYDSESIVADPMFVDPSKHDWRL